MTDIFPDYLILSKQKSAIWSVHPAFEEDEGGGAIQFFAKDSWGTEFPTYEWSEVHNAWLLTEPVLEADRVEADLSPKLPNIMDPMFLILMFKRRSLPLSIHPVFRQSEIDPTVQNLTKTGPGGMVKYHIYVWFPLRQAWIPSEMVPGDIR